MTTADVFQLVGVGVAALMILVGAVMRMVETKHGAEHGCLPVFVIVLGIITALSLLP